jgi:hypothetical protein
MVKPLEHIVSFPTRLSPAEAARSFLLEKP